MDKVHSGGGFKILETLANLLPKRFKQDISKVPVVVLSGVIAPDSGGMRSARSLSLRSVEDLLEKAFKTRKAKAVALIINSPGGSPVQSALIANKVRFLSDKFDLPVYAFCEDVAASGGYWIACCADEIYASPCSVIGSIGVISGGFGLDKFIARYGIERRLRTAGENKGMLDSFSPENPKHVKRLKSILSELHDQFISWVRERRGEKLAQDNDDLFSGAFWTGARAQDLGLVDGLGDYQTVLREKFGDQVQTPLLQGRRGIMNRFGLAAAFYESSSLENGNHHAETLVQAACEEVERRFHYSRFGL